MNLIKLFPISHDNYLYDFATRYSIIKKLMGIYSLILRWSFNDTTVTYRLWSNIGRLLWLFLLILRKILFLLTTKESVFYTYSAKKCLSIFAVGRKEKNKGKHCEYSMETNNKGHIFHLWTLSMKIISSSTWTYIKKINYVS